MAKQEYTASEAAAALGISLDTLRRWDKAGRSGDARREQQARRVGERDRPLARRRQGEHLTARNRFRARSPALRSTGSWRRSIVVTGSGAARRACDARRGRGKRIEEGMSATAIVKSTNVMVQS